MASYNIATPESVYIPSSHQVTPTPDIRKIREWLPWSIVNIFLGWGLGGIIPLIFSLLCRYNKRNNDLKSARTVSMLALVFNILVTLGGIAGWVCLTVFVLLARQIARISIPK